MIKLDLKDAYLMIPVTPPHHKFLCFQWEGRNFHFTCLPFGLSSAPRTFTKVTRPLVSFLRSRGVRMVIYLNDMLFLHQQEEKLLETRNLVLDMLENLGFLVNYVKSELSPVHHITFLGFSLSMEMSLPQEKVISTVREAQKLLQMKQISARQLAHMIVIFSSTIPAVLPAPLHYRGLQSLKHQVLKTGTYSSIVPLSEEAQEDLRWWILHLPTMNGQPILRGQPSLIITSDVSLQGWGAYCQDCRIGGPWTTSEKHLHINCLELLGASHAVKAFCQGKKQIVIHLRMDSSTAIAYINHLGGTRSPTLCALASDLWTTHGV